MNVEVHETPDAAAGAAGAHVAERLREGATTLALSRAPAAMLEAMAKADVDWSTVHLFQVDERAAPDKSPDRNWSAVREHFLATVKLPAANVHPMPTGLPRLADAAARYTQMLEGVCGSPPVLDVVHLGLGPDGHTASLFPGDPLLDEDEAAVAPVAERAGWQRLTLTLPTLNRARHRVWLVTGTDKADALGALLAGGDGIPGARVSREAAVVFADRSAAPA